MTFDLYDFSYSRLRPNAATPRASLFTAVVGVARVGLPVADVKAAVRLEAPIPAPLSPPEVAGLVNLRGRIVTVLRLDKCLGLATRAWESECAALVVAHRGDDYALLVDVAEDVAVVDESARIATPGHVNPAFAELVRACYHFGDGYLPALDVGALIARLARPGAPPKPCSL